MPKLNDRQRRFCELLVQGMSATEAAKQAGYAASTAGSNADKLLKNTNVSDYLAELRAELKDESIADARERAQFWTEVMRGKGSATFVTKEGLSEGPPD